MEHAALIHLPAYESVVRSAVGFLTSGFNVAAVGPPGCGASSVGLRIQAELSAARVATLAFDCQAEGDSVERVQSLTTPKRRKGQVAVIAVDHAASLPDEAAAALCVKLKELAAHGSVALLWLGSLDCRAVKRAQAFDPHTDARTHLCIPELGRDDLIRLYRAIAGRKECQWGEAMLYFTLDWCGNDLALVEELAEYFYGNWSERVYDESAEECLRNWLAESRRIKGYRQRLASLPAACKEKLGTLAGGGKLLLHRPEIHLETDENIRRLFLEGFLATNLLPGYHQFRHLLARFLVEETRGLNVRPIDLLRRSANTRVNVLLQDVEASLRAMLQTVFRNMPPAEVKQLLLSRKTELQLLTPELQKTLLEWAGGLNQPGQPDLRASLGKLLKEERDKFEATSNLWLKVCAIFRASYALDDETIEPTPAQVVTCLTFNELADLLQTLSQNLFLENSRTNRRVDPPKKRWPGYLARVRRLRNEVSHLRNISFQDVEDLLDTLDAIRKDQLDFAIMP